MDSCICMCIHPLWASLVAQSVKNLPAMPETTCSSGALGLIIGLARSSREGNGNPLQYACLENPMDRRAWRATIQGVARVRYDLVTKQCPPWLANVVAIYSQLFSNYGASLILITIFRYIGFLTHGFGMI